MCRRRRSAAVAHRLDRLRRLRRRPHRPRAKGAGCYASMGKGCAQRLAGRNSRCRNQAAHPRTEAMPLNPHQHGGQESTGLPPCGAWAITRAANEARGEDIAIAPPARSSASQPCRGTTHTHTPTPQPPLILGVALGQPLPAILPAILPSHPQHPSSYPSRLDRATLPAVPHHTTTDPS